MLHSTSFTLKLAAAPPDFALHMKSMGDREFSAKAYEKAIQLYSKGIQHPTSQNMNTLSSLLMNRSLANLKLCNFRSTVQDCLRLFELNILPLEKYVKCCFRCATALMKLEKFPEAMLVLEKGLQVR